MASSPGRLYRNANVWPACRGYSSARKSVPFALLRKVPGLVHQGPIHHQRLGPAITSSSAFIGAYSIPRSEPRRALLTCTRHCGARPGRSPPVGVDGPHWRRRRPELGTGDERENVIHISVGRVMWNRHRITGRVLRGYASSSPRILLANPYPLGSRNTRREFSAMTKRSSSEVMSAS